jgi:Ni,Fe-hydrogenase III small subunit/ferredoxin
MPWIPRGLRNGVVTTSYPHKPDGYDAGFRGSIDVHPASDSATVEAALRLCPTGAITVENEAVRLDRGKCVLCGRCTELSPWVFTFSPNVATSELRRKGLVVPVLEESEDGLELLRDTLARRVKSLRRSIHVRHVDAGSDGADEWEVAALTGPIYDVQRLGIYFTASPRHADVLLVTGVGSSGMIQPLQRTFEAMPSPKVVIAAGVDASSGGLVGEGYASLGGVHSILEVDVYVPGSPATPFGLLHGILMAVNLLPRSGETAKRSAPGANRDQTEGSST